MKKHDIHSRHVHGMTPEWRKQLRKGYAKPFRRRCRFLIWAVICAAILAGSLLLAANLGGCANYLEPVNPSVLSRLPADQATELAVTSTNHPTIWDASLHGADCPFLYTAAYLTLSWTDYWPGYLRWYYWQAHLRENHCACMAQIADPNTRSER